MNKYFTPVQFNDPAPEDEKPVKKEKKFPSAKTFNKVVSAMKKEIRLIQTGHSKYTHYAIQLKDGRCPAIAAIERFAEKPSREGMEEILDLSEQDFGLRVRRYFEELFNQVTKEKKNE